MAIRILFLYGPPAAGKLTVAREVAVRTGWRLFHNHLTVDLSLAVYDFGTPGFVALREQIWLAVFRRALADGQPNLIFTFSPESSVPQRFIDDLWREVIEAKGEIVPVELYASEPEIERRMNAESRRKGGKLTDAALYRELRAQGVFATPVVPSPRLLVDTEKHPPAQAAEAISMLLSQ